MFWEGCQRGLQGNILWFVKRGHNDILFISHVTSLPGLEASPTGKRGKKGTAKDVCYLFFFFLLQQPTTVLSDPVFPLFHPDRTNGAHSGLVHDFTREPNRKITEILPQALYGRLHTSEFSVGRIWPTLACRSG